MDGGNHGDEDCLDPAIASSHLHTQSYLHRHQPVQQQSSHTFLDHDSFAPAPPVDVTSSQDLPGLTAVASHTHATNLQAFAANARSSPAVATSAADPDDFYRTYRGIQTANAAQLVSPGKDGKDVMASAIPSSRQTPSLRSNGNGTTPKHPSLPAGRGALQRPAHRSASNPVDDRPTGGGPRPTAAKNSYTVVASQTSVKDLKKRFDQTASQSATPNRTVPTRTASSRDTASGHVKTGLSSGSANSSTAYAALRSGPNRDGRTTSNRGQVARGTSRPKFVAEDQLSSNSQSFASRINRPRNAVLSSSQASKSMTHLSPTAPVKMPPSSSSPPPRAERSNGLLFGEILPEENDYRTVGFGISGSRPRRTSESNVQNPATSRLHLRSLSDPDIEHLEPSSPTDWYRSAPPQQNPDGQEASARTSVSHSRVQSDTAGSKPNATRPKRATAKQHHEHSHAAQPTSPTSRIPVSVKKLSSSSHTVSPASTRSSSPAATKRVPASGRASRQQQGTPGSRSKTTTTRSTTPTTRMKSPTPVTSSSRKLPPSHIATPNSNNRLNAYVAVPPPKLSPPLRSSRPRQSVANATTTASRLKTAEGGLLPLKTSQRSTAKTEETSQRRRKISVGPIDFAQRRETIKLAYSKSIRETQAREAREAAAERRKKELEAVARAKAEAEAAAVAAEAAAVAAAAAVAVGVQAAPEATTPHKIVSTPEPEPEPEPEAQVNKPRPEERLWITTSFPLLGPLDRETTPSQESPTLGIPGSFPSLGSSPLDEDEPPPSAISVATATTDFDAEPQTEPPIHDSTTAMPVTEEEAIEEDDDGPRVPASSLASIPAVPPQQQIFPASLDKRASYHSPFDLDGMSDENVSIQIALSPSARPSANPTPTGSELDHEPAIPISFQDEYEPQPYTYSSDTYQTTVTILGPETDFRPPYKDTSCDTVLALRKAEPDEAPLENAPVDPLRITSDEPEEPEEPEEPDERHAQVESLDSLEEFYIGPRLRDNIAALRDSIVSSSDADTSYDPHPHSLDYQKTPDTSHNLTIPPLLSPANRFSQQSAWTDFSLDTNDDRNTDSRKSVAVSYDAEARDSDSSTRVPLVGNFRREEVKGEDDRRSPETSPLDTSHTYDRSMLDDTAFIKHPLPDVDTGTGFSISYLIREPSTQDLNAIPALPDHDPPPPPPPLPPVEDYDLDEHGYMETRPSSYLDDGDDLAQALSTPHSLGQLSFDATEATSISQSENKISIGEGLDLSEKEQKRLKQRLLVIRELIDTESMFIRDMSVVEEIYKGTAEACPKLDGKTVKLIFRNTDEIISFHSSFLTQLKEGVAAVYTPKVKKLALFPQDSTKDGNDADSVTINSTTSGGASAKPELDDERDRQTSLGPLFGKNIDKLKAVHEVYLRSSDHSSKRLLQIQEDPTVQVWLNECNEVAKDLTAAWNLDSLLIKPMQRITKYPDIITHLLKYTPDDHPDRQALINARTTVINAIDEINKTKKNFELVGQIVGSRKRKDSDVRAGIARAFGKRVDRLQASNNRPAEDEEYLKLSEKFGDDYLRLQVVLRDVEYYTRTVSTYVHEFLQYLSSMELVMRLQPSRYHAHLESKWVQFNVSMRDIEKIALEKHLSDVRKHVIEPFEQVIRCYTNPATAMRKRFKRRLDYEKYVQLKAHGKKIDKQLAELVEQYEALNETLKKELPKLSALTANIGNICLGKFVSIQTTWFCIWKEKIKMPLQDVSHVPEFSEIINAFQREFKEVEEEAMTIGILNPTVRGRPSQSTTDDSSSILSKTRSRPADLHSPRGRGLSINSDHAPSLPTPEFVRGNSGQFSMSSATGTLPSPGHYYRDYYYSGINSQARGGAISPVTSDMAAGSRLMLAAATAARPSTGRSYESSNAGPRPSMDSTKQPSESNRRDSNPYSGSNYAGSAGLESRRFSGLFHSALPMPDGTEESQRPSRASSHERAPTNRGYNVLWLAASLFEFNIETTKHEAGYPYLTYQAGEIFDVIAEKGELWLAKNQDDPRHLVGWIWSKHFAKLADS